MTKKDIIKEIRNCNKCIRTPDKKTANGVFINKIFFLFNSVKLDFDDELNELFIYDRNREKIIASVDYQDVKIGLTFDI